jgi:Spy/CpxP family protein refolding chaperone
MAVAVAGLIAAVPAAGAQKPAQPDAFAEALFDPQLVLTHAQTIGLTAAQRRSIFDLLKATQTELAPLQVEMTEPALELVELLGETKIDEAKVLAKTSDVLRIENQVKIRQTALLVRVKNLLTPEQQARLREIRSRSRKSDAPAEPNQLPN